MRSNIHGAIVVVTGAGGALGSQVAEILVQAGLGVVGIDKAEIIPNARALRLALGGVDLADITSTRATFDRWVSPASLGEVIKFLLSSGSRDITGVLLPVTGRV